MVVFAITIVARTITALVERLPVSLASLAQ